MGDSRLLERYKETMNTYVNDNNARVLTEEELADENEGRTWYLPHHPVTHPLKPKPSKPSSQTELLRSKKVLMCLNGDMLIPPLTQLI